MIAKGAADNDRPMCAFWINAHVFFDRRPEGVEILQRLSIGDIGTNLIRCAERRYTIAYYPPV
jgi:hypothetical protein